ncbi:MAG: hypothetical protein OEM89_00825 [Nitrosopumilus sp.]|nr:hypothetical protein [Nitrosopumilus sp.]
MLKFRSPIAIALVLSVALLISVTTPAFADIIPPKKQSALGISNENIVCESGLFKVLRENSNTVACLIPSHVFKLMAKGWAKPVDDSLLDTHIDLEEKSIGTINTISVTPVKPSQGNVKTKASVIAYDYVFEVCAPQRIYNPTILIQSDSDSKHYQLAETITPDRCILSVSRVMASNMDSIQSTLLNKGEISKVVAELENKIITLKTELTEARSSLGSAPVEGPDKITQGNKIADLRKQINDARAELHRLYFIMYSSSSKTTALEKSSFSGATIQGETATKLSVTKSLLEKNLHIVTFETCAGKSLIKLPVVMVNSDQETKNVKIGTKISPNSCQMTTAKIMAIDPESISVAPVGNINTIQVEELEETIVNLQENLIEQKELLRSLVHNPERPVDFNSQTDTLAGKIIDLKNQIISRKAEFSKIMLETYR